MTTKKRVASNKKKRLASRLSLKEMACWMSARRNRVESLLKNFAILLFGEQLERIKWGDANSLHLFYCDDILLTIEVRPSCFAVILGQGWNWKSSFKKPPLFRNDDELEAFLLKLYNEWNKPKPKQKSLKKRR